jgi:hypothetical protein
VGAVKPILQPETPHEIFVNEEISVIKNADLVFTASYYPLGNGTLINHGGKVLTSPTIYSIFYGNNYWNSTNTEVFNQFLNDLGSSKYLENTRNQLGGGRSKFLGSIIINYNGTLTSALTSSKIATLINQHVSKGQFGTVDPQVIFVLIADAYTSKFLSK